IGLLGARHLDLSLIEAREGLVYDSDAPGHLIVRAPAAVGMRFTVKGREAHAGIAPERGLSAIRIAAEAIAAMRLGRIDGETTANLGVIQGGRAVNIVPDEVAVRGEARSLDPAKLKAQIDHMVACFKTAAARASLTIAGKVMRPSLDYVIRPTYDGMALSETTPLVLRVLEAARRTGRVLEAQATGGGCDANIFNKRGLTVANLGTGMRDIHTVHESIDVNDMISSAEVTVELLKLQASLPPN
ncbi:MAG: M20/M25/M40 family metallo-hydrolase, partial [Candidatus Binataceae bacterium]